MRKFERISEDQIFETTGNMYRMEDLRNVKLPKRATKDSAGYDFFAPWDITLEPNEEIKIPTGIRAIMNPTDVLLIFPRSGLGFKYYCRLSNSIGVIDADYFLSDNEGHMFLKIRNEGNKTMTIKKGEGMCQGIFMSYLLTDDDEEQDHETRNGGFGSTTNK